MFRRSSLFLPLVFVFAELFCQLVGQDLVGGGGQFSQ